MTYPKRDLIVVPECNDDNDIPTCWAMLVAETDNGNHFLWISKWSENEYVVEDSNGYNRAGDKVYKTLAGAKKKAEEIAWRQEETGFFTD